MCIFEIAKRQQSATNSGIMPSHIIIKHVARKPCCRVNRATFLHISDRLLTSLKNFLYASGLIIVKLG